MSDTIFTPTFHITSQIADALEFIDQQKWLFERMLLMPKHQAWIQRQVSTERVAATTAIEGEGIGTEAVKGLARGATATRPDSPERANENALRAYEFVDYLSDPDQREERLNELVIRELNRIFMRGATNLTPGVYRKGENKVYGYTPPNQGDVPALMRAFTNWLVDEDAELHPIIKAGLAHLQLVVIHPFWDGNGRTARALITLILQRSPFAFRNLISVEKSFADVRDEYIQAIERTLGRRYSSDYDATPWLESYVRALASAVSSLTSRLTSWHQMMERLHLDFKELGLLDRQVDGLVYAAHLGRLARADYMEITGVSPVTASRDLAHLTDSNLLEGHGQTRGRYYTINQRIAEGPNGYDQKNVPDEQGVLSLDMPDG